MASSLKQKIREAADNLHTQKESEGVKVNTVEESIVQKAISSIDEGMKQEAAENIQAEQDARKLEDQIAGLEKPEHLEEQDEKEDEEPEDVLEEASEMSDTTENSDQEADRVETEEQELDIEELDVSDDSMDNKEEVEDVDGWKPEEESAGWFSRFKSFFGARDHNERPIADSVPENLVSGEELDLDISGQEIDTSELEELDGDFDEVERKILDEPGDIPSEDISGDIEVDDEPAGMEDIGLENTEGASESSNMQELDRASPVPEEDSSPENRVSGDDLEGSGYRELERRLTELEEKIVDEGSRELGKLGELEKRVERLEIEDTGDIEERIAELENMVESLETPQSLDDRLTELEDVLMNMENDGVAENIPGKVRGRLSKLSKAVEENRRMLETEVERLDEGQSGIEERLEKIGSNLEGLENGSEAVKAEKLWEALDEEVSTLENRIYDNHEDIGELLSAVVELSEMVKQAMNQ